MYMELGSVGAAGLIVIVIVDALREVFPQISGNVTRLVALVIGFLLGGLSQMGALPELQLTLVSGALAGATAVGVSAVARRVGGTE